MLDGAGLAKIGPVAPQGQPPFLARETIDQALAGRTDVNVLLSEVAEVRFAEPALGLGARGHRLR